MADENWIEVGSTDSIEEEDLIRFYLDDQTLLDLLLLCYR